MEYLPVDWIPWWVSAGSHKIQEMDAATDRLEFQMPSIKSDIQALTKLTVQSFTCILSSYRYNVLSKIFDFYFYLNSLRNQVKQLCMI